MAAVLKKRAMAEYSHSNTQVETIQPPKKLRLTKKAKKDSHKEKTSEKLSVISASVAASVPSVKSLEYFISNCSSNESSVTFEIVKLFENVLKDKNASANIISLCEKLISIIKDEKDEILKASLVRIFKEILCFEKIEEYLNFTFVIEELLSLIAITEGKITIAEILDTIHRILENHPIIPACDFSQQLINATKHLLMNNNSHLVKRQSLRLLSELAPISSENTSEINMPITQMQSKCTSIIKLLRDFSHYFDPRVRNDALSTILRLHDRGLKLDFSLYSEFCVALNDDYEGCRMTAMKLLEVLSHLYSDCLVCVNQGDEQIRLVDDAFAKISSMMNDSSIAVRTEAATLLGNISEVSFSFLSQTLNKTLMSNLRKKKSAHERSRESYSAGEWSSGRKWADDAPHEELCPDTINLMDIGACGAFIHGLEDEFMEVRMATLEALCKLAIAFPQFAEQSMDFVVDMFNDEIEDIRLKAIQCLSKISQQKIVLRGDQIEIILSVLEDSSIDIREALHEMLGNCKISTKEALKSCIENIIENMKKYPEDRNSIWRCFQKLGANHAELTLPLVPELLGIHPFLDLTEPSLEDITHIAILILVFNAAEKCPEITKVFVRHTIQHYVYLRDYYSSLVPNILSLNNNVEVLTSLDLSNNEHNSAQSFLFSVFERIGKSMASERMNLDRQTSIIELLIRDLQRLGKIEPMMSHASDFLKQYLECQMALRKILSNNNWINAFLLSSLQSSSFRSSLQQILQTTFALVHQFHGMHPLHLSLILQTRVKALALQLIAVIHGSNASALTLCDAFLEEVKTLERHLVNNQLKPDALVESMLREINVLEHPKPGSVARALQPLFLLSSTTLSAQTLDLTELVRENTFSSLKVIKKSSCTIDEPKGRSENPLKFTAGLILTIKLDAVLYNIKDIKNVRLKIHYPDQQTYFILPRLSDFRSLDSDNEETKNYRLYTNVYISHGVWTEAAYVDICLVLDFRENCSHLTVSQSWTLKSSASVKVKPEESLIIELCKPVKISISPKQHKKALCA